MFGFGKRNKPVQPQPDNTGKGSAAGAQGGGGRVVESNLFPWTGDPSDIACNLACGSLGQSLAGFVSVEGRVHAETYVAASGAIAGFFAQQTLRWERPDVELIVIKTKSGDQYFMGDPLNDMLLAKTERDAPGRVWPQAAGAAIGAGLAVARLPDLHAMFAHVAGAIGGAQEGLPSTGPAHQPGLPARDLLKGLVPQVARILSGDISEVHSRFGPAPAKWWGAITAYATGKPIHDVKDVLDPAIALTILMESAIYGSKLVRL